MHSFIIDPSTHPFIHSSTHPLTTRIDSSQPFEIERSAILQLESVVLGRGQFGVVMKGVYAPGGSVVNRVNIALGSHSSAPIRLSSSSSAATWRTPRTAPYNVAVKSLKKQVSNFK